MKINSDPKNTSTAIPPEVSDFCAIEAPFVAPEASEAGFIAAMRAISIWHQERSPWYRELLRQHRLDPTKIASMADVLALPAVHANFFKQHVVLSVPEEDIVLHLTSSGTTGQKSQVFFDANTIEGARRMVDLVMRARGVLSDRPTNYLVNAYEPLPGMKVGTSNTNQFLMSYAPAAKVFWSLRAAGKDRHEYDPFGSIAALQSYAADSAPCRIIGFPAFLHFALKRMQDTGQAPLQLPAGSMVILGGGWKGHSDQEISRAQLRQNVHHWLGIEPQNVIEVFGSVEHSIPYVSCTEHHLHQPTWSRVIIRDLRSLQEVPDGTAGFLSFLSPYISSVPAHHVVMGDLAVRHGAGSCPCGIKTPWFEVLGRAGTSSNKSCAAAASEMLASHQG